MSESSVTFVGLTYPRLLNDCFTQFTDNDVKTHHEWFLCTYRVNFFILVNRSNRAVPYTTPTVPPGCVPYDASYLLTVC